MSISRDVEPMLSLSALHNQDHGAINPLRLLASDALRARLTFRNLQGTLIARDLTGICKGPGN